VLINGKEAAVVGSLVTTCNDTGAKDNSVIMAPGASMPMPAIANPGAAPEEEQESRHPDFTTLVWKKSKAKEGEKVEITAGVKDITDGNGVTFQVWKRGQDPESGIPQAMKAKRIENGEAKAEFSYTHPEGKEMPEEDPVFFFTAHSAWCPYKKSGEITVELLRPEITNLKWKDKEGNDAEKNVLGEPAILSAETKDIEDGKTIIFKIYPEGADTEQDKPLRELSAKVESNKSEIAFNFESIMPEPVIDEALYRYYREQGYDIPREEFEYFLDDYEKDIEGGIKEKPKYIYTAKVSKCRRKTSGAIEVSKTLKLAFLDEFGNPKKDCKIKVKETDGTEHDGTSDEDGYVELDGLIPVEDYINILDEEENHG
jgi:hypothetical protein